MTVLDWILLAFTVVFALIALGTWLYWKFKKQTYTRERFAFTGLAALLTAITAVLPLALGSAMWAKVFNLILELFGSDSRLPLDPPGVTEAILAFLLSWLVYSFVIKIFNNWNRHGKPVSVRHHKQDVLNEQASIISDLTALLLKKEGIEVFREDAKQRYKINIEPALQEVRAWHEQVAELLEITSNQYRIKVEDEWYGEENCFISRYGSFSRLGVYCSIDMPTDHELEQFVRFVKKGIKSEGENNVEFLVAVKNRDFEKYDATIAGESISFVSEASLLDGLADFTSYFDDIVTRYEEKEIIEGFEITIDDIYTSPRAMLRDRSSIDNGEKKYKEIDNIEEYVLEWTHDRQSNGHMAVLGEYGQGKSVLSLRLAYQLIKEESKDKRIPIVIELRGRSPRNYPTTIALLAEWAAIYGIDPRALLKLHYASRLLIIFEGFDEMDLVGDQTLRFEHFKKLWAFSSPGSKLMITGRPNFFLNDNELKSLLRTSDRVTNLPYCEELYLEKFNTEEVEIALRKTKENVRSQIMSLLRDSGAKSNFVDLMSRPSSLFLASIIWEKRNLSQARENINSALVIEQFLKESYSRQARKGIANPLSVYERAFFMQGIAVEMVKLNGYTNQVSGSDLRAIVSRLYENFPDYITQNQVLDSYYSKPISKRFDTKYNEEAIFLDIRSCGVLVRDISSFDTFKFSHKSFMEILLSQYLAQEVIIDEIEDELDIVSAKAIRQNSGLAIGNVPSSVDVLSFVAQFLGIYLRVDESLDDILKVKELYKKINKGIFPSMILRVKWEPYSNSTTLAAVAAIGGIISVAIVGWNTQDIGNVQKILIAAIAFLGSSIFILSNYSFQNISFSRDVLSCIDINYRHRGYGINLADRLYSDKVKIWLLVCHEFGLTYVFNKLFNRKTVVKLAVQRTLLLENTTETILHVLNNLDLHKEWAQWERDREFSGVVSAIDE